MSILQSSGDDIVSVKFFPVRLMRTSEIEDAAIEGCAMASIHHPSLRQRRRPSLVSHVGTGGVKLVRLVGRRKAKLQMAAPLARPRFAQHCAVRVGEVARGVRLASFEGTLKAMTKVKACWT